MMILVLFWTKLLSWIVIVLALSELHNDPQINKSLHTVILSWPRSNCYLPLFLGAVLVMNVWYLDLQLLVSIQPSTVNEVPG
jgi:hypothetical protein